MGFLRCVTSELIAIKSQDALNRALFCVFLLLRLVIMKAGKPGLALEQAGSYTYIPLAPCAWSSWTAGLSP